MERPGFIFCICPDSRLIQQYLNDFAASGGGQSASWQRHAFWGDEDLPASFWEHLTLKGLFNTPKMLILRKAEQVPAAVWKKISMALGRPNAHCLPFFCLETAYEKGQPKLPAHISKLKCLEFAETKGWIWRSPGLVERNMQSHVKARAKTYSLTFEPGALETLCAALPCNASAVENELGKLALASVDGKITKELALEAGHQPASDIFTFINMIQSGDIAGAWLEIKRGQKDADGLLFPFLGLLLREARTLWQLSAGESPYLHPSSAAAKKRLADRLGQAGIRRLFSLVMEAELSVKAGRKQPDQVLEILVADLMTLFKQQVKNLPYAAR